MILLEDMILAYMLSAVIELEELMKASQAQRGVLAHDSVLRAEIHEICSGPDERGSPKRTKALQDAVADYPSLSQYQLDVRRYLDARLTEYFRPVQEFAPQDAPKGGP